MDQDAERQESIVTQKSAEHDEFVISRLEDLLADMGWSVDYFAEKIHKDLGYQSPKGVIHRFKRQNSRRLDSFMPPIIGKFLGIEPSYIAGYTDDLDNSIDPIGKYAYISENRQLKAK